MPFPELPEYVVVLREPNQPDKLIEQCSTLEEAFEVVRLQDKPVLYFVLKATYSEVEEADELGGG